MLTSPMKPSMEFETGKAVAAHRRGETIGRVAAGAVAKKKLSLLYWELEIVAYVAQIHEVAAKINRSAVKAKDIEKNIVRCPDPAAVKKMLSS